MKTSVRILANFMKVKVYPLTIKYDYNIHKVMLCQIKGIGLLTLTLLLMPFPIPINIKHHNPSKRLELRGKLWTTIGVYQDELYSMNGVFTQIFF